MSAKARTRHLQIITPEEELENLRNEVGVLQRAVESKSAAVGILRSELQECQRERDKFRMMAEQGTIHRSSAPAISKPAYSDPGRSAMLSGSEGTLAQLLSQSKEENKMLRLDVTELKCKLHDAQADIKVLREEVHRLRGGEGRRRSIAHTTVSQLAHQEREQFISQMEALSAKCQALEGDVRGLVEEREELVRELDAATHKLHRLNHILNTVLSSVSSPGAPSHPKRIIDLDAIITENRYLQQRMKQTEEERNLARSNASKYKAALEKCRSQGSLKLGTSENLIVTPKQVGELLKDYQGEVGGAAESDLKSLCVALVDALNQRSRALRTQRSANKVLVGRVTELERQLAPGDVKDIEGTDGSDGSKRLAAGPQLGSLSLMDGYVHPSGPIPKYSQEEILQDPRLMKLLQGSSAREGEVSARKENADHGVQKNEASVCKEDPRCKASSESCVVNKQSPTKAESQANVDKTQGSASNKSASSINNINNQNTELSEGNEECEKRESSNSEKDYVKERDKGQEKGVSENQKAEQNTKSSQKVSKNAGNLSVNSVPTSKVTTYINPNDDLEEIIPIDQLDSYIKEVQLQRKQTKKPIVTSESSSSENKVSEEPATSNPESKIDQHSKTANGTDSTGVQDINSFTTQVIEEEEEGDDDDSSFDLDISDYDSDNDNLDAALEEWQKDFAPKGGQGKKKALKSKSSPSKEGKPSAREKFRLFKRDNSSETELPPALQKLIDQATADAIGDGMQCT
ncbi:coiled-coil domain-containing protein 149-B-like [Penaeus chinensis]|uniref:coiled-coil domain-containing protein 149-B-like n=1 Tax=Penaeus chinensis TaxID=139456 RepID=UPI001FB84E15|nr:coiled-coil domain-containing protein 149-B-like [Penaeus chinensis]